MSRENFNPQIGDLVRFREWEDMKEEFGLDDFGDIDCKFAFTTEMRDSGLCGKEFIIKDIYYNDEIQGHGFRYSISKDMIENVNEEPFDTEELDKFFDTIIVKES